MTANVTYDFSGQVAVITGAARGVGRALVESFAAAGAHVVAADRDEPGLAQTCAPYGDAVLAVTADVSTEDGAAHIIDGAAGRFGALSICVNNAAVAPHTSLLEETAAVWDTVYAVNCRGTFLMTQLAGRAMIAQGQGGWIVNFSSGVSSRGSAGAAAYASSRAATESFSRVAAIELAPYGILVNCVSPGLIDTQPRPAAAGHGRKPVAAHPGAAAGPSGGAAGGRERRHVALLRRRQLHDRDRGSRGWRGRGRRAGRRPDRRRRRPLRLGHRTPADLTAPGLAATRSR